MDTNVPVIDRTVTSGVTPPTRPTVNPHAAIGALVLWLRDEGVSLAGADQSPEACRRRVTLARELLDGLGVNAASAADRAAAHATNVAVVR